MPKCLKCGELFSGKDKFCSECGKRLKKRNLKLLFVLFGIIIIGFLFFYTFGGLFGWGFDYSCDEKISFSKEAICSEEGTNDIILEAFSNKYPEGQIISVYKEFRKLGGCWPFWSIKIRTADGKVAIETIENCKGDFLLEQCEEKEGKEKDRCYSNVANFYKDVEMCKEVINSEIRDRCYIWLGGFYDDVEICKKIWEKKVRNNCFALVAGLSAPHRWAPFICEDLTDDEAKQGCIEFFEK